MSGPGKMSMWEIQPEAACIAAEGRKELSSPLMRHDVQEDSPPRGAREPATPPRGNWDDSSPLLYSLSSPFSSPGLPTHVRLAAMREERASLLLLQKQQQTEHLTRQLQEKEEARVKDEAKIKKLTAEVRGAKADRMELVELHIKLKLMEGGTIAASGLKMQLDEAKALLLKEGEKAKLPSKEIAAWRAAGHAIKMSRERTLASVMAWRSRKVALAVFGALKPTSTPTSTVNLSVFLGLMTHRELERYNSAVAACRSAEAAVRPACHAALRILRSAAEEATGLCSHGPFPRSAFATVLLAAMHSWVRRGQGHSRLGAWVASLWALVRSGGWGAVAFAVAAAVLKASRSKDGLPVTPPGNVRGVIDAGDSRGRACDAVEGGAALTRELR